MMMYQLQRLQLIQVTGSWVGYLMSMYQLQRLHLTALHKVSVDWFVGRLFKESVSSAETAAHTRLQELRI
jgi:hypothetical protein